MSFEKASRKGGGVKSVKSSYPGLDLGGERGIELLQGCNSSCTHLVPWVLLSMLHDNRRKKFQHRYERGRVLRHVQR
eukprot:9149957-Pyramimonas_sp.AAC.1